jgi:hypothetical protein
MVALAAGEPTGAQELPRLWPLPHTFVAACLMLKFREEL